MTHRLTQLARRFVSETAGSVAIWSVVAMPVLVGGAALAVDVSRLQNMDQNMQAGADALARAGAAELDSRSDAISRAQAAIADMIDNDQRFAESGAARVRTGNVRFLTSLPARSDTKPSSAFETTNPRTARYVEVTLATETVRTVLPPAVGRGLVDVDMNAIAIAGREERVCGVAPVFLCNPNEGTSRNFLDALEDGDWRGRQFQLKRPTGQVKQGGGEKGGSGGDAVWAPGSFGYLEISGANGANAMREAVGIDVTDTCYGTGDTVRLETGNITSMHFGFNTRFDIYGGPMSRYASDARFAPAQNVTHDGSCTLGLPRDTCHILGSCGGRNGEVGGGDWDITAYMAANHGAPGHQTIGGTTYSFDYRRGRVSPRTPSRHDVYRWEIESGNIPSGGTPSNHSQGASTADVDRRVISAAVLNCSALEASGGMRNRDLPVETFVDIFLTEPVGSGSTPTIYGEIVGATVQGIGTLASERVEIAQ